MGLSGGVDSAVSAALLQQQGYEVTGVFIRIAISGYPCPAAQDRIDAMRVAAYLKIPFREVDLSRQYEEEVFRPSIEEFRKGRTPNPDTLCNEKIKFGIFFDYCMREGADYVATGHYAQVANGRMYVSADSHKDQTYFLWAVPETVLAKTLFPVGGLQKPEVRKRAEEFGLPNSARPDSQGLCFLGDIGLGDMLAREVPQHQGRVLDEQGNTVGTHQGVLYYTIGQRHGFELTIKTPSEVPHFVMSKNVQENTITVSTSKIPLNKCSVMIVLTDTNWIGPVTLPACKARFRYRQELIPAEIVDLKERTEVLLTQPYYVPEGQSLVLYQGERCIGGGIILNATLK